MNENRDLGFCPRCGALMQDGVCRSCGYTSRPSAALNQPNGMGTVPQNKKKTKGWIIGLSIAGAVLLVGALIAVLINVNRLVFHTASNIGSGSDGYDDYYDYYDEDSDDYTPSADDSYYEEIVDTLDEDASYTIDWLTESRFASASDDNTGYYVTYPELRAKEEGGKDYSAINAAIKRASEQYQDSYTGYSDGITTTGYVTFMNETEISVVFQHRLAGEDGTLPRLSALNFNLETGEQLAPQEMTDINEELVMRFRAQDKTQNDGVDFVQDASDEKLLTILQNPEEAVYFYSPVGLEVGFNYTSEEYGSGWVSVTLKEQAL